MSSDYDCEMEIECTEEDLLPQSPTKRNPVSYSKQKRNHSSQKNQKKQ